MMFRPRASGLACAACVIAFSPATSPLQATVVLSKLNIVYPAIAESARVRGTVRVRVVVSPDGSIAETRLLDGIPLLSDAAVNAASHASFECRGCTEPSTPHVIAFVFSFDRDELTRNPTPPEWKETGNSTTEVRVFGHSVTLFPPGKPHYIRDRAARCLWLWHCSKPVAVVPIM
jgi:TonB family protein